MYKYGANSNISYSPQNTVIDNGQTWPACLVCVCVFCPCVNPGADFIGGCGGGWDLVLARRGEEGDGGMRLELEVFILIFTAYYNVYYLNWYLCIIMYRLCSV